LNGKISITATESVTVSNQAKIRMAPPDKGAGVSGRIEINAPTITMDQGIIQSLSIGAGNAGLVKLSADNITLLGSQINSQTQGFGRGGDVTLVVTGSLVISGQF